MHRKFKNINASILLFSVFASLNLAKIKRWKKFDIENVTIICARAPFICYKTSFHNNHLPYSIKVISKTAPPSKMQTFPDSELTNTPFIVVALYGSNDTASGVVALIVTDITSSLSCFNCACG